MGITTVEYCFFFTIKTWNRSFLHKFNCIAHYISGYNKLEIVWYHGVRTLCVLDNRSHSNFSQMSIQHTAVNVYALAFHLCCFVLECACESERE